MEAGQCRVLVLISVRKSKSSKHETSMGHLAWRIWKERNSRIFDQLASSCNRVLDLCKQDIAIWRAAGCITELLD